MHKRSKNGNFGSEEFLSYTMKYEALARRRRGPCLSSYTTYPLRSMMMKYLSGCCIRETAAVMKCPCAFRHLLNIFSDTRCFFNDPPRGRPFGGRGTHHTG